MKSKFTPRDQKRRDFLVRGAFTMGAAASLVVVTKAYSEPIRPVTAENVQADTNSASGYRLTPHIKDYYAKARF
ncbi:MAG: hypothetical protein R3188_01850 [Acidiferrobacterales bacterium]|jgi:hypothetical protein|nr:hypothetical protein [Acidiferrobacterales bacterium]